MTLKQLRSSADFRASYNLQKSMNERRSLPLFATVHGSTLGFRARLAANASE